MTGFQINRDSGKITSISRTIRMKAELFEQITLLCEQTGVSFNKIVNQCIEYALENQEPDQKPDSE